MIRAFSGFAALVAAGLFCTTASASFVVFQENFDNTGGTGVADVPDGWTSSGVGTSEQTGQDGAEDGQVFKLTGSNTRSFTTKLDFSGITGQSLTFRLAGGGTLDPPNSG